MFTHIVLAIILALFVGGATGYIGSLMLSKRMSLIGGPLGHLALPGMAIALRYGFDVSVGAFLFLIFGSSLIWCLQQKTKLPFEAITATVFASSYSIAFLILKKTKVKTILTGDLSQISPNTVLAAAITSVIVFVVARYIYKKMVLISISSDLAETNGVGIKFYNFIYMACIAIVIALSVRIVGGLMTAALVAIPACTSKNISRTLTQYSYTSLVAGAVACTIGILISIIAGIAPGPPIVITSTVMFVASIFMGARSF